jgi:hypothetical protein
MEMPSKDKVILCKERVLNQLTLREIDILSCLIWPSQPCDQPACWQLLRQLPSKALCDPLKWKDNLPDGLHRWLGLDPFVQLWTERILRIEDDKARVEPLLAPHLIEFVELISILPRQ